MFRPAARVGTYDAPASAHDATTENSTRFMRIAISVPPAVSTRRSMGLGVVSRRAMGVPGRRDRSNGQGQPKRVISQKNASYIRPAGPAIQKYFLKSSPP